MNKYDLLRKAELLGLATILSITGAKVNNVVNEGNKVGITQTIDAKVKQPKAIIKYFKNTKIKQSVSKTTLWSNGKKKKVVVTKYNKQKKITSKVTKTYNNKGVILKSVKITYNYKNLKQFKTITTIKYVNGKTTANKASTTTKVENKNGTWSETTKVYDNNKPTTSTTTGSNKSEITYKTTFVKDGEYWVETTTQYTNNKIIPGSTEVRKRYMDKDKNILVYIDEFVYTSASSKRLEKGSKTHGSYYRYTITYENNKPVKMVQVYYGSSNDFVNNKPYTQIDSYLSGKRETLTYYDFDSTNHKVLNSEYTIMYQNEYNAYIYEFINSIEPKDSHYVSNPNYLEIYKGKSSIQVNIIEGDLDIRSVYSVYDSKTYIRIKGTSLPTQAFASDKVVTDKDELIFYGSSQVDEKLWVMVRFNQKTGAYSVYKLLKTPLMGDKEFNNPRFWTLVVKSN